MGLLTVYQLDLGSSPTFGGLGAGQAVPAKGQTTPQRATMQWVTGRGFFMTESTTQATQPFLGKAGATPQYPYVIAADQTESQEVSVAALSAGSSTTISTLVSFALPQLALDPTDNATLLLIPDVWQDSITSGLVLSSIELAPQALTSAGWIDARTLQGGQTYTSWRCQATIGLVAVTATAATKVHVGAQALLTVLPG